MGLPFLVLVWTHSLAAILFVVVVFVFGEMLWVPTSQAVVADLAPADIRGASRARSGRARDQVRARAADQAPDAERLRRRGNLGDVRGHRRVAAVLGGLALAGLDRPARREPSAVLEA